MSGLILSAQVFIILEEARATSITLVPCAERLVPNFTMVPPLATPTTLILMISAHFRLQCTEITHK